MLYHQSSAITSYNPWIYCSLNKNFRKAAFRVFCCCCLEEDDELSSSKGGGGGGGSHHDHFSNEGGRPGSSRLLSKVPCCTKKLSGKKDDESRLTNQQMKEQQQRGDGDGGENGALINSKTGQSLPTGALRSGSGGNLDPSCFGNMSCVTETSMVAFNSAGSIERLNHDDDEDVVVPLSAPASVAVATTSAAAATVISKKKHKFNFFRKQNRLGSSSSRGRAAELCQIKIEECSDKMTADSREGHSSSEMLRRSLNQNAEKTKKDNGGGGDLKHQFSDSIDSEEDESDECLLNEGRSPGSRSPRASIEMQSMQQLKQKQQKQQQQRNAPESSVHLLMDCGATPEKGGSDGKTEKEVKFACGDGDEDGSKSNGGVVDGGASLALLTTDL